MAVSQWHEPYVGTGTADLTYDPAIRVVTWAVSYSGLPSPASQLCVIACHTWDTLGAVAAGWSAALIRRVGNDVLGVDHQPQIVGGDLNEVADQLIARHAGRT